MKKSTLILSIGIVIGYLFYSCESDNINPDASSFRIEFSDGTTINKHEINFYDSSTHTLFLKKDLDFNKPVSTFKVFVDSSEIYQGIIYSCNLSSPPPATYFINNCFFYGHSIIEIGAYREANNLRNDKRIIHELKSNNLLRNGVSCVINSVKVKTFENNSEVSCTVTIKNNDNISYYIPDPVKMGELDFNYYTGGLSFKNNDTHVSSFIRWSVQSPDWSEITLDELSILKAGEEVVYTFKSNDYYKIEKGNYHVSFRFCGLKINKAELSLDQKNGRIWLGDAVCFMDNLTVD